MRHTLIAALLALCLGACVTKREHEELMADANRRLMDSMQRHQADMASAQASIVSLQNEIARVKAEIERVQTELAERDARISDLQTKLDDAVALNERLRELLERAGKNVEQLVSEKGDLDKALADTKARLEELRKAQEAAQQRAQLYRQLLAKFKKMVDAGDLSVVLRDGRMVLQLRNDVLFDSGKVALKKEGRAALEEVAKILATLDDRKLQVAGHTDNVPISTERFPSNRELSAARAVNVVKFLTDHGVPAGALSAAGYGEFDPVAGNDTAQSRAKNRRIEIVLQPNIAELVQIPQ